MRAARLAWRGHMPSRRRPSSSRRPTRSARSRMRSPLPEAIRGLARKDVLRQALVTNHERRVLRAAGAGVGGGIRAQRRPDARRGSRRRATRVLRRTEGWSGPWGRRPRSRRRPSRLTERWCSAPGAERQSCGAQQPESASTRCTCPAQCPPRCSAETAASCSPPPGAASTLWRTDTGHRVAMLAKRAATKGAFSPDGRLVATLDAEKHARVRVFDARTGRLLHVLAPKIAGKRVELEGVAFSPDNRLLATPGFMGHVPLERPQRPAVRSAPRRQARRGEGRGLQPGRQPARRRGTRRRRSGLGRGEGRSSLLLSASQRFGQRNRVEPGRALPGGWRRRPDRARAVGERPPRRPPGRQSRRPRLGCVGGRLEPGRTLAAQRQRTTARRGSGTPSSTRSCSPWEAHSAASALEASFDPAGRRIVSAGTDGTARIWSVRGRHLLHVLSHKRAVEDAEFSPDGRLVVTASSDGTAGIWSSTTGARLRTLQVGAPVSVARFSPDGAIVVTGDADGGIRLWRASDGKLLGTGKQQGKRHGRALRSRRKNGCECGARGRERMVGPFREADPSPQIPRRGFARRRSLQTGRSSPRPGNDGAARIWETAGGKRQRRLQGLEAAAH